MPVEIKIWHDDASQTLAELRVMAGGLTAGGCSGPLAAEGTGADCTKAAGGGHAVDVPSTDAAAGKPARGKRRTRADVGAVQASPSGTAETEAQDDADEQAESAARKTERTHDDVRAVLGRYVQKFGMDAAQEDGPKVITMLFGEGRSKVSDIPEDQDSLAKAVAGVEEMLVKNPFKRAGVA